MNFQPFRYRQASSSGQEWKVHNLTNEVTELTLTHLLPNTQYEFILEPWNFRGPGTKRRTLVETKGLDFLGTALPTDVYGSTYFPQIQGNFGVAPGPPQNFRVDLQNEILFFTWIRPLENPELVHHYAIEYKKNEMKRKKRLAPSPKELEDFKELATNIRETEFRIRRDLDPLGAGGSFDFRVRAHGIASYSRPSNSITFAMPGKN